jgi:hypothetical protein
LVLEAQIAGSGLGHALSARALEEGLDESVDMALWAAIRQFEQRANLQLAMAQDEERKGRSRSASSQRDRATEAKAHAKVLRTLLTGIGDGAYGAARLARPAPRLPREI